MAVLLAPLMSKLGNPSTRLQGVVVNASSGGVSVNVNGNVIPVRVIDPLFVTVGDAVAVDFVSQSEGLAEAWVIGRLASLARPQTGTVTVVPVGSQTISVKGTDGTTYSASFLGSYTPTVNDVVVLAWYAGNAVVMGKVGTVPAPPPAPAPVAPPPTATTGTANYAATDSSTWWDPGGWDSWAGGGNPYEGNYGSGDLTGAWWYGGAASQLSGRTINAIRLTLGGRNGAGASSSTVAVQIWTHLSGSRPGGNVALSQGPYTVQAAPWQGPTTYGLPTSFAADLQNGGGIAIFGGPYAGFYGRNVQPNSGALSMDWSM